jgi:hypothetical protein
MVLAVSQSIEERLSPSQSLIESQSSSTETLSTFLEEREETSLKSGDADSSCSISTYESSIVEPTRSPSPPPDVQLVFRMPPEPELLRQLFLARGWSEYQPDENSKGLWNFCMSIKDLMFRVEPETLSCMRFEWCIAEPS